MKFNIDVDYINARPRYGHLEGSIYLTKEEKEEFKTLLNKDLNDEEMNNEEYNKFYDYLDLVSQNSTIVIDDWDIEDYSDACWRDLLEYLDDDDDED